MNLHELEHEAMHLTEEERAELAQKLLLSLEASTDEDIANEWLAAADQRARELDAGLVESIPAEEVRRKALALLR